MNILREHYREFFKSLNHVLFKNVERVTDAEKFFEVKEMKFEIEGMSVEQIREKVEKLYGTQKFDTLITKYIGDVFPDKGDQKIKDHLIEKAKERYRKAYERKGGIFAQFGNKVKSLGDGHSRAISTIITHTENELGKLHNKMDEVAEAVEADPKNIPKMPKHVKESKVDSVTSFWELAEFKYAQQEVRYKAEKWMEAKLKAFMTTEAKATDIGEKFQKGFLLQLEGKVDQVFESGTASKETLQKLKKEMESRLSNYSRIDGKPGDLSLKDISILHKASNVDTDFLKHLNTGSYNSILKRLEVLHGLSPESRESWVSASKKTAKILISESIKSFNEQALIDTVNEYAEKRPGVKKVDNFSAAEDEFLKMVDRNAKAGVKETFTILESFNKTINAERAKLIEGVKPPSLKQLVHRERMMLLRRRTIPENERDNSLVEFMSTTREGRASMLANPRRRKTLYLAIAVARKDYSEHYKDVSKNLPNKISKLTSSRDPSKPTGADKAARTKALIILAEEAAWVIGNLDKNPVYKDMKLGQELAQTHVMRRGKQDKYLPDLNFRDVNKLHSTGYVTAAAQGGFTGKGLGLSFLKGLAIMTVVTNGFNAIKNAEGKTFLDKVASTGENLLQNPFLFAGLGVAYGIDRYREDHEFGKWITGTPGRRARVGTRIGLNGLARKFENRGRIESYIKTEAEWDAMAYLKPNKIKQLIKKANKEKADKGFKHPMIRKEDLKGLGIPKEIWVQLPDDDQQIRSRVHNENRFAFYSKFLMADKNIAQLREASHEWI